ncbi:unnamed protein product [Rhizoctonia solani]|uniref:F-box domain-containing protein n=1 Tax=Rhizoctonia solani TaxID=456999 RepID=A0A8H3DWB7_9AGAM|nr:unnamed protein product [Rhizoctonia solani]
MHASMSSLQPVIIQQLAATTDLLATTASRLYELSTSLENQCAITNTPNPYLKSLDSFIETLQSALAEKLIPARVILAKTRNRQALSIMSLPPEILSWIFSQVVYEPYDEDYCFPFTMRMDARVCRIYRRVHALIGVCRTWHQLGLACPDLWKLIPLFTQEGGSWRKLATKLSLERAGNKYLCLAVASPLGRLDLDLLSAHWHCLGSINIWFQVSSSNTLILNILGQVIKHGKPHSVTALSLNRAVFSKSPAWPPPDPRPHLNLHRDAELAYLEPQFSELVNSLERLRLSNVSLDWASVRFSGNLVELQISNIRLYGSSETAHFLRMLSTAYGMRILAIDSIAFLVEEDEALPRTVSLPKLESLSLKGIPISCTRLLLTCISLGRCTTTLDLRGRALYESDGDSDLEEEFVFLRNTPIHRLKISPGYSSVVSDLRSLLMSMPNISALTLQRYDLNAKLLQDLTPPTTANETFPRLETLEFYNCDCVSPLDDLQDTFRALLSGHHIQKMVLGCSFFSFNNEDSGSESEGSDYEHEDESDNLEHEGSNDEGDDRDYEKTGDKYKTKVHEHADVEKEQVIEWLRDNVPEFYLCTGSDVYDGPTGDADWQLWDM